jgi:hypothetical protein
LADIDTLPAQDLGHALVCIDPFVPQDPADQRVAALFCCRHKGIFILNL